MINYFPRTYEDRSVPKKIIDLLDDEEALVQAKVISNVLERRVRKGLTIYRILVQDETGTSEVIWYNQVYLKNQIKRGKSYKFYGKVSKKFNKIENMLFKYLDVNKKKKEKTNKNKDENSIKYEVLNSEINKIVRTLNYKLSSKNITDKEIQSLEKVNIYYLTYYFFFKIAFL